VILAKPYRRSGHPDRFPNETLPHAAKIDLATTIPFRRRVTLPRVDSGWESNALWVQFFGWALFSGVWGRECFGHAAKEIAKLGKFSSVTSCRLRRCGARWAKCARRGCEIANPRCVHLMNDWRIGKEFADRRMARSRPRQRRRGSQNLSSLQWAGGVVGDVAGFVAASYLRGVA